MDILSKTRPENMHHAYYIVGPKIAVFENVEKYLHEMGIQTNGNPDFVYLKFDTLKIEDARDIALTQERRGFSGKRKVFIIESDFITEEAQNSLLKVLEEPTPMTHFFVISPQEIILPTLKSRMQVIFFNSDEESKTSILTMSLKDRLAKVKEIAEAISEEDSTKQDAIEFLNQIERELYSKGIEKYSRELENCEKSRLSLYDRGAPVKMILEQLVLSI